MQKQIETTGTITGTTNFDKNNTDNNSDKLVKDEEQKNHNYNLR